MPLKKPEMILIDVDGTMVDSVPDLAYCVDEMLRQLDMPVRGEDRVRQWVGNGVERLVERALADDLDGYPDEALKARAYPIFLELYADNTCKRSMLYPGVRDGLDYLVRAGYKLGCVTNKDEAFTVPLLKELGIYDKFAIVISGDTLPKKKPDPAPLLHATEFFGVTPAQSTMIGDSVSDVKAARAAGFQIICMTYGYNHGKNIADAKPDALIDSMVELESLLEAAVIEQAAS
jgi:phosphoglycolate phosphatase